MNNKGMYGIIPRNTQGVVLERRVQNLIDENGMVRPYEIPVDTKFTVVSFDLYSNRANAHCNINGKKFIALLDFYFLTECCILDKINRDEVVNSVYIPEQEIDVRIKLTRYEYVMQLTGCILIGLILGGLLSCLV